MFCWSRLCIFFSLAFFSSLRTARLMNIHILQVESSKSGWLAGWLLAGCWLLAAGWLAGWLIGKSAIAFVLHANFRTDSIKV